MRGPLVVTCAVLVAGCYLSHERGVDGGAHDAGATPSDASLPIDPCGSVYVALDRGCRSFTLPPTGIETCTTPDGASVHGPSFVFSVPSGTDVGVHITGDGTVEHAFGPAVDACGGECTWGHGSSSGGGSDYFRADVSVRYVVGASTTGHPFDVTICPGERAPD